MSTRTRYDVFVSHSFHPDDKKLALKLQEKLKEKDLEGYLAEKEKRYGYIISNKIREAVRSSRCIVVILTKNSIISASVNQELGYGMGIGKTIIPMVFEEVKDKVGVMLLDLEGEFFTESDFDQICDQIVDHVSELPSESEEESSEKNDEELFKQERGDF